MNYYVTQILNSVILIPAIVSIFRYQHVAPKIRPFIWYILFSALTEVGSFLVVVSGYSNTLISNIYVLLAYSLILYTYWRWDDRRSTGLYLSAGFLFLTVWITEAIFLSGIWNVMVYFRICCSFVCVLFGVNLINVLMAKKAPFRLWRGQFLLLMCLSLYLTVKVLVEIFYLYGLGNSRSFLINTFHIIIFVNVAVYIGYTFALLWIPRKRESLLPLP